MKGKRRFRSLRVDLSLIIGVMIVILVAVISIIAYQSSYQALKNVYIEQMFGNGTAI
jgi:capsular polysaccharide biosynthesis protein